MESNIGPSMSVLGDEANVDMPKVPGYAGTQAKQDATRNKSLAKSAKSASHLQVACKQDGTGLEGAAMYGKRHPAYDRRSEESNMATFAVHGLTKDEWLQKLDSAFQNLSLQITDAVANNHRQLALNLTGELASNPVKGFPLAMPKRPNSSLASVGSTKVEDSRAKLDIFQASSNASVSFNTESASQQSTQHQRTESASQQSTQHQRTESASQQSTQHLPLPTTASDRLLVEKNLRSSLKMIQSNSSRMWDGAFSSVFFHAKNDLQKPQYHVEDEYSEIGMCQAVARSAMFTNITLLVIFLDIVYTGVDADWNTAPHLYQAHSVFLVMDNFFCMYFTGELLIRMLAFHHTWACLRDWWFRFDLALVVVTCIETWIYPPVTYFMTNSKDLGIPVGPMRSVRLLRLTRISRLARSLPDMVTITKSMLAGMRAVLSCLLFIATATFTFAIMLHAVMVDDDLMNEKLNKFNGRNFTSVGHCMWTLIIDGILLLDTHVLLTELMFSNDWHAITACFLFFAFILLSSITVMNILIGILCEVVSEVAKYERNGRATVLVQETILKELRKCDDGDGKISKDELAAVMTDPASNEVFQRLRIDRLYLHEIQAVMFGTSKNTKIDIEAVMELVLLCRGDLTCTVEHMANAQASLMRMLHDSTYRLEQRITSQGEHIASMVNVIERRTRETYTKEKSWRAPTSKSSLKEFTENGGLEFAVSDLAAHTPHTPRPTPYTPPPHI